MQKKYRMKDMLIAHVAMWHEVQDMDLRDFILWYCVCQSVYEFENKDNESPEECTQKRSVIAKNKYLEILDYLVSPFPKWEKQ